MWTKANKWLGCGFCADLQAWRAWTRSLQGGPSHRRSTVQHCRLVLRWGVELGVVDGQVPLRLVAPRVFQTNPKVVRLEHLVAAVQRAQPRVRPWLLLAAGAGLRCCEIAPLLPEDLVLDDGSPRVIVRRGKGGEPGTVPVTEEIAAALRACDLPTDGWLFPAQTSPSSPGGVHIDFTRHVSAHTVSIRGREALAAVGSEAGMHGLRHLFGDTAWRTTKDLRLVQDLMRHKNVASTVRYTRADPAFGRSAAGAIGQALSGAV